MWATSRSFDRTERRARFGRVRREHGTELEACKGRPDAVDVDAVLRYSVQGVSQECSLRSPGLAELRSAMDLFCDVGELEVSSKGAR